MTHEKSRFSCFEASVSFLMGGQPTSQNKTLHDKYTQTNTENKIDEQVLMAIRRLKHLVSHDPPNAPPQVFSPNAPPHVLNGVICAEEA